MSLNSQFRIYGSPLSRPKVAKFALVVLVVITIITTNILVKHVLTSRSSDQLRVFFLALFCSSLLSIVPITVLRFLDRREQKSTWLYVITFVCGALIATGIALPINGIIGENIEQFLLLHTGIQQFLGAKAVYIIGVPLATPIVEETTKGISVLLLFWLLRAEFDSVRDGFIYGALIGIGFNFLESAIYVLYSYANDGIALWGKQLGARYAMFGLGGHALYTGIFGMGLGLARQTMRDWLRYAAPIIGWLIAFLGHLLKNGMTLLTFFFGIENAKQLDIKLAQKLTDTPFLQAFIEFSFFDLITFFPFFLVVVIMLWRSSVWERQVIRKELASEEEPMITKEEYEAVKRDSIFKTHRVKNINRHTRAAIVKAQSKLAIRKWRVKQKGQAVETDALVLSWRNELVRLRNEIE